MQLLTILTLVGAACVIAQPHSRHHKRPHHKRQACRAPPAPEISSIPEVPAPAPTLAPEAPAGETPAPDAEISGTLVLFEIGGVPGNECLTFRNNGRSYQSEIVIRTAC